MLSAAPATWLKRRAVCASAAAAGQKARYEQHASSARDEGQLFRCVLHQLGWPLPPGRP